MDELIWRPLGRQIELLDRTFVGGAARDTSGESSERDGVHGLLAAICRPAWARARDAGPCTDPVGIRMRR
jgi:hypothetical protein